MFVVPVKFFFLCNPEFSIVYLKHTLSIHSYLDTWVSSIFLNIVTNATMNINVQTFLPFPSYIYCYMWHKIELLDYFVIILTFKELSHFFSRELAALCVPINHEDFQFFLTCGKRWLCWVLLAVAVVVEGNLKLTKCPVIFWNVLQSILK